MRISSPTLRARGSRIGWRAGAQNRPGAPRKEVGRANPPCPARRRAFTLAGVLRGLTFSPGHSVLVATPAQSRGRALREGFLAGSCGPG